MLRRELLMSISISLLLVWIAATPLLASRPGGAFLYSSHDDVAFAQAILAGEGYLERGDYRVGSSDRATTRAIADFQQSHHLNSHGRLDFDTMAMLSSHEPAPAAMARSVAPPPEPPPAPEPQAAAAPPPPAREPAPPAPVVVAAVEDDLVMPETASAVPLLALGGGLLIGLGLLLLVRRPA